MSPVAEIPPIAPEMIERYGAPAPRYTSYPTVPHWLAAEGSLARRNALAAADRDVPLSLYVHVPFCEKMCDFCGCNVIVRKDRSIVDRYLSLLEYELDSLQPHLGRRTLSGLHLGGGTPTFMTIPQMKRLLGILRKRFDFAADADLSIEANPNTTTVDQIKALADLGFNRISLGVQDMNAAVLEAVGRAQTVEQTKSILEAARGAGFTSVNVDLIYGLPKQTIRSWAATLDQLADLQPDRVAVFAFAYVPTLRPNQRRLEMDALPDLATKLDLYRQTYQLLVHRGYAAIGLDHFALPEDPLGLAAADGTLGRNFQGYVADDRGDLLGIGVSSISEISGAYMQNHSRMKPYRGALEGCLPTLQRACRPTEEDRIRRRAIMTLMCHQPVDLRESGISVDSGEFITLERLAADGLIRFDGRTIEMTEISRPFLRRIASSLDPAMRDRSDQVERPTHSQSL